MISLFIKLTVQTFQRLSLLSTERGYFWASSFGMYINLPAIVLYRYIPVNIPLWKILTILIGPIIDQLLMLRLLVISPVIYWSVSSSRGWYSPQQILLYQSTL